MTRRRPKIIIDGRKDAEWLHDGRNWFVAEEPKPISIPPEAFRNAKISYWSSFLLFSAFMVFLLVVGWVVG